MMAETDHATTPAGTIPLQANDSLRALQACSSGFFKAAPAGSGAFAMAAMHAYADTVRSARR